MFVNDKKYRVILYENKENLYRPVITLTIIIHVVNLRVNYIKEFE